jgi:hypothetical protein
MPGRPATALQRVGAGLWIGLALSLIALGMFWHVLYGLSLPASAVATIFSIALATGLFWALARPRTPPGEDPEG